MLLLFLGEAVTLSVLGGLLGLASVAGLLGVLKLLAPAMPIQLQMFYLWLSLGLSASVGLLSGIAPAWRASHIDPIEALRVE